MWETLSGVTSSLEIRSTTVWLLIRNIYLQFLTLMEKSGVTVGDLGLLDSNLWLGNEGCTKTIEERWNNIEVFAQIRNVMD